MWQSLSMFGCVMSLGNHENEGMVKGGFLSEKFGQFFHLPKNIPFFCFKFVHPIHDIDNMSIVKKFIFTGFIYVQVQKVGFTITTDNLICSQHFKH